MWVCFFFNYLIYTQYWKYILLICNINCLLKFFNYHRWLSVIFVVGNSQHVIILHILKGGGNSRKLSIWINIGFTANTWQPVHGVALSEWNYLEEICIQPLLLVTVQFSTTDVPFQDKYFHFSNEFSNVGERHL